MISRSIKSKHNETDAAPRQQYPHQTASGRREIRAASDHINNPPVSRLQEPRSPDRAGIAYGSTASSLQDYRLTSTPGSPHKPCIQDFQHEHQPSRSSTSSRPLSPTDASTPQYHASSSPPRKPSPATVDVNAGKIPKTWTRNSIRIPIRTRYAILEPRTVQMIRGY
jgi:hypothetical protein